MTKRKSYKCKVESWKEELLWGRKDDMTNLALEFEQLVFNQEYPIGSWNYGYGSREADNGDKLVEVMIKTMA